MREPKVLVFDLETTSLDTREAEIVVAGIWTNTNNKSRFIWRENLHLLKKAIKQADFIVTFNGTNYDNRVLINAVNKLFKYESTLERKHIDLYTLVKNRKLMFGVPFENGFGLDAVCESLGIGNKVADFDHTIFRQETFSKDDIEKIEFYLQRDVDLTRDLYLYCEKLFSHFKEFLPQSSIDRKHYLFASTGTLAYKVLCEMAGLVEEYSNLKRGERTDGGYKGGAVLGPYFEEGKGTVWCVDYTSEYPHAYMQANLYTHCKKCTEGPCKYRYTGGTTPEGYELKLSGEYCTLDGMGPLELAIKRLFLMRRKSKQIQKDGKTAEIRQFHKGRQESIKTIINTIYGISGAERFKTVYNLDTAQDCTRIGRFEISYMHWRLKEAGYKVLYGDTDSAYIEDPFDDKKRLREVLDSIIADLKSLFPFPQDTFDIDIEDEMSYIKFFKDGHGGYKGKTYLYLTKEGKVKGKGMKVIKSDATQLSRLLWKTKIQDFIKKNNSGIIPKYMLEEWIDEAIKEDPKLVAVEFNVKSFSSYSSPNQLHAQISKTLGEGKHMLVKNRLGYGIGKGVKYITLDDASKLSTDQLDLTNTWAELEYFIAPEQKSFDLFM